MLIRFPAPLRDGEPTPANGTPPPAPAPTAPPAPTPEPPAEPPIAKVVVTATKTEAEERLERENAELRGTLKARETEIATVQDENHRLKSAGLKPAPKKVAAKWGFFGGN